MTVLEQINNQEVDNQISVEELRKAIKPGGFFDNYENIHAVGQLLNNMEELDETEKELINSLKSTIDNEINTILEKGTATEEDIKLINVRKNLLGENDNRIQRLEELINGNENNIEVTQENKEEIDINTISQEIDNEINMILNTPLSNLQELGIDISEQNNKKGLGILWENILKDIKNLDDLQNITEENVNKYINIPNDVPKENYEFIAENLKNILYKHLKIHPEWKAILQKGGYATGMSIESVVKNDEYIINLFNQIEKLEKKSIEQQIETIVKNLPNNSDLLDLWLKKTINSNKNDQNTILKILFEKIPVESSDKFFQTCEKNKFINELKNNYAKYWLNKNNSIKSDGDKYCFLDRKNKKNFEKFYGKGITLSDGLDFDDLYTHTKEFYEQIKEFGFDITIPLNAIIEFLNAQDNHYKKIKQASDICEKEIRQTVNSYNPGYMPIGGSPSAGHAQLGGEIHASKVKFQSEKSKACAELEKEYVKVLLQRNPKPTGEIMGISGAGIALKFYKDPLSGTLDERADKIVRDTFTEQLGDQREKFKYDLKNDKQAAFGSLMGMIGGIAGSAVAALVTKNIWATSAGFTAGLRLGNGISQELWNGGEFLYEQITGSKIDNGDNGVQRFGQGFLRGVGALDQNYEYVGTAKFLSGLGFDYLSTVATFGLSQKFGGFLGKLEGIKFAGGALKFGMEELILENFLVDIPMNTVQSGFEAFTGIDNGGITVGNTSMGNEHTVKGEKPYEKGSLSDMLRAMKDAGKQNLSFENLSQTFFNTVIYGGLLEGGGAAIRKIKGYLPAGQVADFTEKSAIAATAFAGLTNFMSGKNINFNKEGKCIDTTTNLEITESDPRFKELCTHLNAVNATKAGVIESFEAIIETQKQMIADPENRTGLLFRLGLISPTNTPLIILKKKKELVEKKLNEAKSEGDYTKIVQIEKLLKIYTDAETKLNEITNNDVEVNNGENSENNENNENNETGNQEITEEQQKEPQNIDTGEIDDIKDINLTEEQINNIKKIKEELGISVDESDIDEVKDINLTEEQIENIKKIKEELGISIYARNIDDIKDINLTEEQINNIKKIKEELGIRVDSGDIDEIKDINLTEEQINNIKKIKEELGINIYSRNIDRIKDIKLTKEQIKNIKKIIELGISVDTGDIDDIKDINLTKEQIENIKKIKEIGISIYTLNIDRIKDIKLTKEQIENIKKIIELGISIKDIKDINLTKRQIKNIKNIIKIKEELGIDIRGEDIKNIKDMKLTKKQIKNIKKIKEELGIRINRQNIDDIKDINLTEEQINNIKKIKEELGTGINIYARNIKDIKDVNLTEEQIENIKKINEVLGSIDAQDIDIIKDIKLTEEQIENIKKINKELGIRIYPRNIDEIKDINLTEEQIENIKMIKKELGIGISAGDINRIKDMKLTEEQIENIKKIKQELGINIEIKSIDEIKDINLTEEQIEYIKMLKKELGISIGAGEINDIKDMKLTEEQIEYIKKTKEDLGIEISINDIKGIINNPEILSAKSEKYYEGYKYKKDEIEANYNYKKGIIIESIQKYVQDIISENINEGGIRAKRDISAIEIITHIRANLVTLPLKEKIKILGGINKITKKFNTVRKYIDFENGPYKDKYPNAKTLLCAIWGITDPNIIEKITDDITVIQHGVGLHFFVGDETSYQIIWDKSLTDSGERTGGFNTQGSEILGLEGTLSVGNSKNPGIDRSNYYYGTVWHEGQHNRNTYFMIDKKSGSAITRAKDEILAFLRDGRGIFTYEKWNTTIEKILTKPKSEGGLYQYGLEGEARENHKNQVRKLLRYANDLIELTKDVNTGLTKNKVISMLSNIPVEGRKDLHSHIIEAVKLHKKRNATKNQIQNLRQRFVDKIKERSENSSFIRDLANRRNSRFSNYKINLDGPEFWWTLNAKKENIINEIYFANSINKVKHILNNPKYSNIGRGINNKGGIEISAIIDEVIAGRVESDILPLEIRPKIERLIKK